MPDLTGKSAVVTGASQGVGRGIALALAECGARVFLTGKNKERLEQAAAEAAARGGEAVPVVCDHSDEGQVRALAARVGRPLHILVNNAWGGYEKNPNGLGFTPFWDLDGRDWEGMFQQGLQLQFLTARLLAPALFDAPGALLVNTVAWSEGHYLRNLYYDVAKQASIRMSYAMNLELAPRGVTSLALAPGFVRTERVLAAHAARPFDLSVTESPEYAGRAVAHLAADPALRELGGQVCSAGDLARKYGFTDVDGRQPLPFVMAAEHKLD
jgi:NAD(P)-dependent dehydrogenase (short-subunit alcohol dehydrogenase family)